VITAVSRTAAAAIPKKWGEVVIVPNALDVASYRLEVGRIARRIAFLGRDDPRKGLDVLLEAWPQIRRRVADAELVVMGASRDKPIDGVSFRGWVSEGEKRRLLATSAVYVAPHLGGESFGIVIAEAMAAGCAVVATDLPAFREVMRNTGVVVAPGDVAGLTAAVAGVLDDPDRVAELGERARAAVARFDWSSVLDQYLAVYRRAIGL
jgi:phosphatidylinositol alpha-mannosyltransferase